MGVVIFWLVLNLTDLGCWRLTLSDHNFNISKCTNLEFWEGSLPADNFFKITGNLNFDYAIATNQFTGKLAITSNVS